MAYPEGGAHLPSVDIGLDRRAQSAGPLVSALTDHAAGLGKTSPSVSAVRRLVTLLDDEKVRRVLETDLGSFLPQQGTMQDLNAVVNQQARQFGPPANASAAKEEEGLYHFLRAIATGDRTSALSCLQLGLVTSGKVAGKDGVSLFWHAVVNYHLSDVALAVFRKFPPQAAGGVDILEVHPAGTLLHMLCAAPTFDQAIAELFFDLMAVMPVEMQQQVNTVGQTFLHLAAERFNVRAIAHAITTSPCLANVCAVAQDSVGRTPVTLLAHRLDEGGLDPGTRRPPAATASPDWDQLPTLCPSVGGAPAARPFTDVEVEVDDERTSQVVRFPAHRVILAAASSKWHDQLLKDGAGAGAASTSHVLRVDPACCRSAQVVSEVLHFIYYGEFRGGLGADGGLLWQLFCLCMRCSLPELLRHHTTFALLQSLDWPENVAVVPVLVRALRSVGVFFSSADRRSVVRQLLRGPGPLLSAAQLGGEQKMVQTLKAALDELEELRSHSK